jgi:uncharacterized membrane-anchored protein
MDDPMGNRSVIRRCLAVVVICLIAATAAAAPKGQGDAPAASEMPDQIFADAMRQSIGAPARADLGAQAAVRLENGLVLVPHDPAVRLLRVNNKDVPPDFLGLILTSKGMDALGYVRFIPAGYIDANAALEWTADDILDSLRDTVEHANAQRQKQGLPEREVRRWVRPPHYDADGHTLSWAALIIPKSAPRESDGEIIVYGLAFGREGYIQVSIPSSVEDADYTEQMVDSFLLGVSFKPGKTYADYQSGDKRAQSGLAGAMGIDMLHKAQDRSSFWSSDVLIPAVGALVATIGAFSLFFYVQRHLRRMARRV